MTANKPYTILLFSWEPWGDMWYSKQHYAAELAKSHDVYFISPPDRWKVGDLFSRSITIGNTPENVHLVTYRNRLPLRLMPSFLARTILAGTARRLAKLLRGEYNILWYFHPTLLVLQDEFSGRNTRWIYHVVDWYDNFAEDQPCAEKADLVIAVNPRIAERYRRMNLKVLEVPHGISRMERHADQAQATGQTGSERPYLVLAGELSADVNLQLLIDTALRFPECDLRIAGKLNPLPSEAERLRQQLLDLPNVVHMGILHPKRELKTLIRGAKAGLVTYGFKPDPNYPEDRTRTPLKTLTYLAQHVPVITTTNCHIEALDGKAIFRAHGADSFLGLVQQALNKELQPRLDTTAVDAYLDGIEYGKLTQVIMDRLQTLDAGR